MKKCYKLFIILILNVTKDYSDPVVNFAYALRDMVNDQTLTIFEELKKLPKSGELGPQKYAQTKFLTSKIFIDTIKQFITICKEQQKNALWFDNKDKSEKNLFIRKLIVPADSEIEIHADFHGDGQSLIAWLESLVDNKWLDRTNPFKIIKKNAYLLCLGDYANRGKYGAEIFFILYQLYFNNPDQVILLRGNHEEKWVQESLGFSTELDKKFKNESNKILDLLAKSYKYLPTAFFLGCENSNSTIDFVLFAHGCIDTQYNPQPFLDDSETNLYQRLTSDDTTTGFTNCLFDFNNESPNNNSNGNFSQSFTTNWFKKASQKNNLYSLFRGHQHGPHEVLHIIEKGKGIYRLWSDTGDAQWDGDPKNPIFIGSHSVWTLNVAPFTGSYSDKEVKEKHTYDTVATITLKNEFKNWLLQPRHIV